MAEIAGVDFSSTKPDPAGLAAVGFAFVVGYLKPLQAGGVPNPKELTADYITRARAAGLAVIAVFESTADRALGGAPAGAADGATAAARAAAIGYPEGCVIFWAVDFPATGAQLPVLEAYGDAFAAAVGAHPEGPYGSLAVVEHFAGRAGHPWRWQTAAWSGGQLSQHAHLYQRAAKHWPNVAGTDENVLCAPLPWFGPACAAVAPAPSPAAAPAPAAPAPAFDVRSWRAKEGDTGPHFRSLQTWLNRMFPGYPQTPIAPVADRYGPQTSAVLREYCRRKGIRNADGTPSDGRAIGPKTAAALADDRFPG